MNSRTMYVGLMLACGSVMTGGHVTASASVNGSLDASDVSPDPSTGPSTGPYTPTSVSQDQSTSSSATSSVPPSPAASTALPLSPSSSSNLSTSPSSGPSSGPKATTPALPSYSGALIRMLLALSAVLFLLLAVAWLLPKLLRAKGNKRASLGTEELEVQVVASKALSHGTSFHVVAWRGVEYGVVINQRGSVAVTALHPQQTSASSKSSVPFEVRTGHENLDDTMILAVEELGQGSKRVGASAAGTGGGGGGSGGGGSGGSGGRAGTPV